MMVRSFADGTVPTALAQGYDGAKAILWYDYWAEEELKRLEVADE